ncbi:MAG: NMD3-related protein [Candidatus Thorarchaeota archaeon]
MGQICCKCGKGEEEEKIVDGFCLSCYAQEFPLILSFPEKELNITSCKLCGDIMYRSKWLEVLDNPREAIFSNLEDFIAKAKKAKNTKLVLISDFIEPEYDVASRQTIKLLFEGSPKPEIPVYQQEVPLDLIVNIGTCVRCSQLARGYFESIVQIRSDRRDISEEEQILIGNLIKQKKEELTEANRMAYISKTVDQARGGIDLYIGNEKFAKSLAHYLANLLAASIEYSNKLKTQRDGRPVYQSTYCVRVPYFEVGDIVDYQNIPHQITGIHNGRLEVYNLKTQEKKNLTLKESNTDFLTVLKKKGQLQKFIIISTRPTNTTIMNLNSYENIDIDTSFLMKDHVDGEEIVMIELDNRLYECFEM